MLLNRGRNGFGFVDGNDSEELLNPEGWTTNGPGVELQDDLIVFDPADNGSTVSQMVGIADGPYYGSVTIDTITEGAIELFDQSISTPGTHVIPRASAPSEFIITNRNSDAVLSNVSFKLLNDAQLGSELVTNGNFASGEGWTFTPDTPATTPWDIVGGVMSASSLDEGGYATATAAIVTGNLYKLTFTILNHSDSDTSAYIDEGGTFNIQFTPLNPNANGTYVGYDVATATGNLALYDNYGLFSVDNVSLKKYTIPA